MSVTIVEKNKAIVTEFLEVFSTGDVEGIAAGLHDQANWWVSGKIDGLSGNYSKEEMTTLLKGVTTLYKQGALHIKPLSMIAEGDYVAVEAESFAELQNGRVYNCLYHFLFQIVDGKIKHVKEYMDTHHAYNTFIAP
jgi:uncharacterized protein